MSISDYTSADQRQARKLIERVIIAGLVPMITACPGVGKSAIVKQIAHDNDLIMIDHRLSTSAPEDLTGLPKFTDNNRAEFVPFSDLFPLEGDELPEGKNGWLLFLDELPSAPRSVQAAAYKLILDRQVGQYNLHEKVFIVAAGNRKEDRAIVNDIGTAMQSRLIHIDMSTSFDIWRDDVALPQNFDSRVIAYLSMNPSELLDFKPDHQEKTFACPRTWEFVSKLIKGRDLDDEDSILLAGALTSGVAVSFVQFTRVYQNLPTIESILANPTTAKVPSDDPAAMWAVTMSCVDNTTKENYGEIAQYIDRLGLVQRILFFRAISKRIKDIRNHPSYAKGLIEMAKYINS